MKFIVGKIMLLEIYTESFKLFILGEKTFLEAKARLGFLVVFSKQ